MREMEIMAKRNSSPSPGPYTGCNVTSAIGIVTLKLVKVSRFS